MDLARRFEDKQGSIACRELLGLNVHHDVYFTYIDEIKKAVVGSMPDHLCMGHSDNRSRRNKP